MNTRPLTILGNSGSLREHSYNRALLHAAQEVAPPHVTIRISELGDLPLYSQDLEDTGPPDSVLRL